MLENSNLDNLQSTVGGADRGDQAFIEGMDATVGIQRSQIEISNIASGKAYETICKTAYRFRFANGGLFPFALEGGNQLMRRRLRVAFSIGGKHTVMFAR